MNYREKCENPDFNEGLMNSMMKMHNLQDPGNAMSDQLEFEFTFQDVILEPSARHYDIAIPRTSYDISGYLTEIGIVCEKLNDGACLLQVSEEHDLMRFAVAHMICNVAEKFPETAISHHHIIATIAETVSQCMAAIATSERTDPGRDTIITAMVNTGILPSDFQMRSVKPIGSIPSMRAVGAVIEGHTKISTSAMVSPSRLKTVIDARFAMIWVMRHVCGHSLTTIGNNVGGRDHTTILSALNKVRERRRTGDEYRKDTDAYCKDSDIRGIMTHLDMIRRQMALKTPAVRLVACAG